MKELHITIREDNTKNVKAHVGSSGKLTALEQLGMLQMAQKTIEAEINKFFNR